MPNGTGDVGYAIGEGAADAYGRFSAFGTSVLGWLTLLLALILLVVSLVALFKLRHTMYYFFSFAGLAGVVSHLFRLFEVGGYVLGTVMEWLVYLPLALGLLLALRDRMLREFLRNR